MYAGTRQVGLHQYKLRLIFEIVDLPMSWPADVNAHEAIAYCNWRTRVEKVWPCLSTHVYSSTRAYMNVLCA